MRFLNLSLFISLLILSSCGGEQPVCKDCEADKKDTVQPIENTLENAVKKEEEFIAPSKEVKENHDKIVQKYGEQWDFCKCVVANDSINDAFEKRLTPQQEDKLMARWDYVDIKCKELTTLPNTTPEEREKHDKKVLKCLKQNGLRK